MNAEEKLARLKQINLRKREIKAEETRLDRERDAIINDTFDYRRPAAKALSDSQIDAVFAGILAEAK